MSSIRIHLLDGFDDPGLSRLDWCRLLSSGDTDTVFQTWEWQRAWWDVFGRGKLLLLVAEQDGQAVACAPLFCDGGMVFFVGSGGSDYLGLRRGCRPAGCVAGNARRSAWASAWFRGLSLLSRARSLAHRSLAATGSRNHGHGLLR